MKSLILASASASRADLLSRAGVPFRILPAKVDEAALKQALSADGANPREIADALAQAKAVQVSRRAPGLVLGADTTLELEGRLYDKPANLDEARDHLVAFAGKTHFLHSAAVIAEGGQPLWRCLETARLTVRPLSSEFLDGYLQREGQALLASVGAYRLEGLGAQLFERIQGDYFTILGLPLLQVMDHLRRQGIVPS